MTAAVGLIKTNTLSVWDRATGTSFLVDTGADVCVSLLPQTTSANVPLQKTSQRPTVPKLTHGDNVLSLLFSDKESDIVRNFT